MLHASPCSAKVMAPLQSLWGDEFTTIAFDLPGFGLSQPPETGEITIPRLADIIAAGMRALGLANAALYGRHTGASVCLEIALRCPDLAAMLLTDGLPVFAAPYTEERLREYLPPIETRWDGGHLTWAFFRYREQHMFWPWNSADLTHRADTDLPDIDFLHRGTVELLEAASTYARVYRSAFLHETLPRIGELCIPAYFGNRPGDSQYKTIPRYPPGAAVHVMPRDHDLAALEELALLRRHPASSTAPPHISRFAQRPLPDRLRDYITTRHGDVGAIGCGLAKPGVPLLYLHDIPGGISLHEAEITTLSQARPVVAIELAGNGESDARQAPDIQVWLDQIADVLALLGWSVIEVYAHGTSAALALALAARHPACVSGIVLRSPPILDAGARQRLVTRYAPDISPSEDGSYLLRLWHHLRDQELWWPWFERTHEARKATEPRIDPDLLHRKAVTLLKQPRLYAALWQEVLSHDLPAALGRASVPVQIVVEPTDTFAGIAAHHMACRTQGAGTSG
ncbi:MAG: hypothetical protein BGO82_03095 [Devosia sp. 67-54]|nr:MAG: hypothetical protein BGO82_03095 [Devosia sp. 67-54]